jgi:hypothetical protein
MGWKPLAKKEADRLEKKHIKQAKLNIAATMSKIPTLMRIDSKWWRSEFLNFRDEGPINAGRKTHKYTVISRHTNGIVGHIKWYLQWRQYCFFPLNVVLDKKCLREIAEFSEQATEAQRDKTDLVGPIPGSENRVVGADVWNPERVDRTRTGVQKVKGEDL